MVYFVVAQIIAGPLHVNTNLECCTSRCAHVLASQQQGCMFLPASNSGASDNGMLVHVFSAAP
eukprot:887669-Lingulodinium_polyedra.AAC.1